MNLSALATLYVLVGIGAAMARLSWRMLPRRRVADAALLFLLWPLIGPFFVLRLQDGASEREVAFLLAVRRARDTPLAELVPDADLAHDLAVRIRVAARKVAELDRIAMKPEFQETEALSRVKILRERGASSAAIAAATSRIDNIRRLRAERDRYAHELDEIGELIVELSTQAEVVRLSGALEPSCTELMRELIARIEALDSLPDDDPDAASRDGIEYRHRSGT